MEPILHAMLCLMQEGFSKCWDALCLGKGQGGKKSQHGRTYISCMPGPFIAVAVLPPRSLGKVRVGWHSFCSLMLVHGDTFLGSFSHPGFLCLKVLCAHMLGAPVGPPVPRCLTATQRLLKAHTSGGDASYIQP